MAKVNYLNNKDILKEIQKSKSSYSSFIDEKYEMYDVIVQDKEDITKDALQEAKAKKAKKIMTNDRQAQKDSGLANKDIIVKEVTEDDIKDEDIVWRVMTWEHIPENAHKRNKTKKDSDDYIKILFPPYKHYIIENDELKEVGRSHWEGGIHNGYFNQDQGKMTNKLCRMFMKLVDKYGSRGNWRGYSYLDEMKARALLQLTTVGLQFDESRSDTPNPFSYYTVVVQNAFTSVLNMEKKNQNIRDDILTMSGATPSLTRQVEHEVEYKTAEYYEDHGIKPSEVEPAKKYGFGSKATLKSIRDREAKEKARAEAEANGDTVEEKIETKPKKEPKPKKKTKKEQISESKLDSDLFSE